MKKASGRFGKFGGQYVPETLMPALIELDQAFLDIQSDKNFQDSFAKLLRDYVGRPSPLQVAENLTSHFAKAKILLKREDLNHTGAHKINNALGQALLTKKLNKRRIIAETGAGQHGVATATACALLGLECIIYMGARDIERQGPNVFRMRLLGAKVKSVTNGQQTLKEATSQAIRDWVENVKDTHYIIGSASGPHPFPSMVCAFQSIIGRESKAQCLERYNRLPDYVLACIGGGSNAIGIFDEFLADEQVKLIGIEAGGHGDKHAATLTHGKPGILHGTYSYLLHDQFGRIAEAHSISAGLDYPGVGPQHSHLKDIGRVQYDSVSDESALNACKMLARKEGIIPALESSHALAYLEKLLPETQPDEIVLVNLSGRGDKDLPILTSVAGFLD